MLKKISPDSKEEPGTGNGPTPLSDVAFAQGSSTTDEFVGSSSSMGRAASFSFILFTIKSFILLDIYLTAS